MTDMYCSGVGVTRGSQSVFRILKMQANQSAAAHRRPAGQSDGSDNLAAIVAADRAFPAAVAELDRSA